jgi:hypothetical protein
MVGESKLPPTYTFPMRSAEIAYSKASLFTPVGFLAQTQVGAWASAGKLLKEKQERKI